MIYLLKSAEYENNKFFFSLKIGYTNDEETDVLKNRRLSAYLAHHRSIELIHIIPNGTDKQEQKLHFKFNKYLWKGDEWYYYNDEMINYIKSASLNDLDKLPTKCSNVKDSRKFKNIKRELKDILGYAYKTIEEIEFALIDAFLNIKGKITGDSVLEYLKSQGKDFSKYYEIQQKIETEDFGLSNKETNHKISDFLRGYQTLTRKGDKLRMLCELDMPEGAMELILNQIQDSDHIKSYYINLGPKRIRELGYNSTLIEKELGIVIFSPELLQEKIYSDFREGEKLLLVEIKDKLTDVYSSISYQKTPKAIDIKEFFEVKEYMTTITIENKKKRVHGYELIKKLK